MKEYWMVLFMVYFWRYFFIRFFVRVVKTIFHSGFSVKLVPMPFFFFFGLNSTFPLHSIGFFIGLVSWQRCVFLQCHLNMWWTQNGLCATWFCASDGLKAMMFLLSFWLHQSFTTTELIWLWYFFQTFEAAHRTHPACDGYPLNIDGSSRQSIGSRNWWVGLHLYGLLAIWVKLQTPAKKFNPGIVAWIDPLMLKLGDQRKKYEERMRKEYHW